MNQEESKFKSVDKELPLAYETGNWDGKRSDFVIIITKDGDCEIARLYSGFIDGHQFNDWYTNHDYLISAEVVWWANIPR